MYKADEDKIIELKQDEEKQYGILGVEGLDVSFPPMSLRVAANDIIVCFTDGLTDALNKNGDEFSKEKIFSIIKEHHNENALMIINRIMDALYSFLGRKNLSDDVTVIVLKRTNSAEYIEEI